MADGCGTMPPMSKDGIEAINLKIIVFEDNLKAARSSGDSETAADLARRIRDMENDKTVIAMHDAQGKSR